MAITLNEYNHATPVLGRIAEETFVDNRKYFSLHDNRLDGSYKVLGRSGPSWGRSLSGSDGVLPTPFVVTVSALDNYYMHTLRLRGDAAIGLAPTAFKFTLYDGDAVVFTRSFVNDKVEWLHYLDKAYKVTGYTVEITAINLPGYVARLTSIFDPHEMKRSDTVNINLSRSSTLFHLLTKFGNDVIKLNANGASVLTGIVAGNDLAKVSTVNRNVGIVNNATGIDSAKVKVVDTQLFENRLTSIDNIRIRGNDASLIENRSKVSDSLRVDASLRSVFENRMKEADKAGVAISLDSTPTNIHTRMKDLDRAVYGKVMISYMNPLQDTNFVVDANNTAYNTRIDQLLDGVKDTRQKLFMLHNNKLDGSFKLIGDNTKIGWWSGTSSLADGTFKVEPVATINFSPRLIQTLELSSSKTHGVILVDFTVNVLSNGTILTYNINDNSVYDIKVSTEPLSEVSEVEIIVHKINKAFTPANITEVSVSSVVLYNQEDLMSIDFLEEISYKDEVESLGGVSANEISVVINNDHKQFYFNSPDAIIAKQLKKNRKIMAYLGSEVIPGEIEWYQLGTFWSYSWDVPVGELYAKVVAFDTLGLLNTFQYRNRHVLLNASLGDAIDVILTDARNTYYSELTWQVDPVLYNVIIPYIWFNEGTYMNALDQVAQCYRVNVYCDRRGTIVAKARKPIVDIYDTWSDSTNVFNKTYPTLYTEVPNVISVAVTKVEDVHIEVISHSSAFTVPTVTKLSLLSSKPIIGNEEIIIDADAGVTYTYTVFSWGMDFVFSGIGSVRGIKVIANAIETRQESSIVVDNDHSVRLNGVIEMNVRHNFIQTVDHAAQLANEILADVDTDIYDTDVEYRGDIALSIDDPIVLNDTITPTNKYRIKRHSLYWDGSLYGTAKLNT